LSNKASNKPSNRLSQGGFFNGRPRLKLPLMFWFLMSGFALFLLGISIYILSQNQLRVLQAAEISTDGLSAFVSDYVEKNQLLVKSIAFHHKNRILKLSQNEGYPYDLAEIQADIDLLFSINTDFAVVNRVGELVIGNNLSRLDEEAKASIKQSMKYSSVSDYTIKAYQLASGDFTFEIFAPVTFDDEKAGLWVRLSFDYLEYFILENKFPEYTLVITDQSSSQNILLGDKSSNSLDAANLDYLDQYLQDTTGENATLAVSTINGVNWQVRAIEKNQYLNRSAKRIKLMAVLIFALVFIVFAGVFSFVRTLQDDREKLKRDSAHDELFNAGPTVLLEKQVDMRMSILYASPNAQMMLGEPSKTLVKKSFLDWINPEDRDLVRRTLLDAYKNQISKVELIYRIAHAEMNRDTWIYDLSHIVYNYAGKPTLLRGYITSIHAQKTAEKNATDLIQSVPEAIFVVTEKGQIRDANQQAEKLLGYSKDDLQSDRFVDWLDVESIAEYEGLRRRFLKLDSAPREHFSRSGSLVMVNAKGQKVSVEISFNQIELSGESLLIQVVRDVTIQVQTQKQLSLAKEEAEALARARSRFVASISHEIRTPMNGVLGMADLLSDTHLDSIQHAYLGAIKQSGDVLLKIINEVLDFAKLDEGQVVLNHEPFNILTLVDETVHIVSSIAEEKGVLLELSYSGLNSHEFVGDKVRLQQVLLNLLGNALKFTEEGRVTVQVSQQDEQTSSKESLLQIRVVDTGIGIAHESQEKLFDSFTQADEQTSRQFGGTGLGLAICKQIVDLMRGEIGVHSKLGQGSEFWVNIPLDKVEASKQQGRLSTDIVSTSRAQPMAGKTVLLIEDNEINQNVIVAFLQRLGAKVDLAENGLKGVDFWRIHSQKYALILMDCQMPVMDGVEATRMIRAEESLMTPTQSIAIIALTANVMQEDRQKCLEAGMTDFLAKPIERESFNSMVVKWGAD